MLYIYYTICNSGSISVYAMKHYQLISENVKLCVQHLSVNILKLKHLATSKVVTYPFYVISVNLSTFYYLYEVDTSMEFFFSTKK
jgi:hypothetical protein